MSRQVRIRLIDWDDENHYRAADEALRASDKAGLSISHQQVSDCGGVFIIGAGDHP
jgi:hypothetical protein